MQISKLMIQQGEVRKQNKCANSFGSVWLGYTPTPAKSIFLEASQSGLYGLLTFPILCRCVDHFNFAWLAPTVGVLGLKIYFRFSRRALFLKQLQQIKFSTPTSFSGSGWLSVSEVVSYQRVGDTDRVYQNIKRSIKWHFQKSSLNIY